MGLAPGHGVLGRICGLFRAICQETGIADRGGQSAGLVVLWFAIGGVRACILVPARERDGRIHRHAGGRGGGFLGLLVYGDFVSLVQRDRLCSGDRDGLDCLVVAAVAAKVRSRLTARATLFSNCAFSNYAFSSCTFSNYAFSNYAFLNYTMTVATSTAERLPSPTPM